MKIPLEKASATLCDQWLWEQAAKCAEEWFDAQCRNNFAALYLYFKRGELIIVGQAIPEGYELATGQRISPGWTKEQAKRWIYDTARRLPCLPEFFEEEA